MAFVNAGIKELYIATNSAASGLIAFPEELGGDASYANVVGMGIRQDGSFTGGHFNEFRDNKNRAFPNLFNFKAEIPTMELSNDNLIGALINSAKVGGASTAIVTSGVIHKTGSPEYVHSPSGGIFIFESNDSLGIDFELNYGLAGRTMAITLEGAFPYGTGSGQHATLISGADTRQLEFVTDKLPMLTAANVIDGSLDVSNFVDNCGFLPLALSGMNPYVNTQVDDWNVKVSTKSQKNGFNFSKVSSFDVEIMAQCSGPDVDQLVEIVDYEWEATDDISIAVGSNVTLVFKKDGLTRIGEFDINDGTRTAKFTWTGSYDIEYVVDGSSTWTFSTYLA